MIATDRFIFCHLHTCGGEVVPELLLRHVPGARSIGRHLPRRLAPPVLARLPLIGFVRNPWAYYAIWFTLESGRPVPGRLFRAVADARRPTFEDAVRNLLDLGRSSTLLDHVIKSLPPRHTGTGMNLPGAALESMRQSGLGFFSFLYRYMYDAPGVAHIRRIERLRHELVSMLVAVGQPVGTALRMAIESAPDDLVPRYTEMYSDSLRDLVGERDAPIIDRFGYTFGE